MADAKQCDRCGKYYSGVEEYPIVKLIDGRVKQITRIGNSVWDCDLCDDCCNKFSAWWENK